MAVFLQVVFPVLLIFAAGYVIQLVARLDIKSLATITLYIMLPNLVFKTFYEAELNQEYVMMLAFAAILLAAIIVINKLAAKIRNYDQATESGMILSTAFMNSGNYGTPIILFAFGKEAFMYAVSFMVLQAIIMNFFGVYYAARGSAGIKLAFQSVLKMPPTYAVLAALVMNLGSIPVPGSLMSVITLVGDATIPTMMITLGMQLAEITVKNMNWMKISYAAFVRLLASPLIAYVLTLVLPMDPMMANVLIVAAACPSAATTTMYALQFDAKPGLVSSITLVTTLLSLLTIPILLILLGA
ncbi:AEC family transporter [Thalassobacillus devorans]|uniref:AEC family transporter n=1 Tax=Thalassobacillus devorans TaxID=279813 RepID=UPI00048F1B85|nr:AEC family transporter [Thalassobacillus devorans]